MRQGDTWKSVEGGNLPLESIRSIDMNEVYWNIEKAGAKGGVTAKLFEVEGISAELKVGGGTAGGYFYRVTISRAHILDLPLAESAAVATPPTCGDLACGYDYAAEILCGELIFQAATSNAFDANGGIKVDAWNLEIGGALKAEYAASKEVKRSGSFIAVPRPYWELGQGKFCDDPYQEGLRRGKECSAIDMCRQPCLTRQMRLVKDRKWDEEGLGLFLDGFDRGFDKYSPLAFRQSCRPGENMQRQM